MSRSFLALAVFAGLAACGGADPGAAPEATVTATALPAKPQPGDEALCAALGGADEAARADAAAKLAPRFAPRPDDTAVAAARSWCLGAWERTYMHDCGENGMACAVDECAAWQHAHGLPEQDAVDACLQDCNCGE